MNRSLVFITIALLAAGVALANGSGYGLGSAVFTRKRSAGLAAARSLRTGMTSVNSIIGFVTVPALPFGGTGESGFGRIHGADGLREFTRPKAITRQRHLPRKVRQPMTKLTSFDRTERDTERLVLLVGMLHGRLYRPRTKRFRPGRR